MTANLELEKYLNALEVELQRLPAAKKAEIVLDVKNEIETALQSGEDFHLIISRFGSAPQLGQKYLRNLGYVNTNKKKSHWLKWLLGVGVSFFLLLFIGVGIVVWKFSPVISVDETTGRFQFLGGVIDIQASPDGSFFAITPDSVEFSGQRSLRGVSSIQLELKAGSVEIESYAGQDLVYECEADEDLSSLFQENAKAFLIGLKEHGAACSFKIPQGVDIKVDIFVKVQNGVVEFDPIEGENYNYDLSVGSGNIGKFNHSSDPSAFKIKIEVDRGVIQ